MCAFPQAFDTATNNTSSASCKEAGTSRSEHGRRHLTKKHLENDFNAIYAVDSHFRRAIDYKTY